MVLVLLQCLLWALDYVAISVLLAIVAMCMDIAIPWSVKQMSATSIQVRLSELQQRQNLKPNSPRAFLLRARWFVEMLILPLGV